jgi:hypothetical protein
VPSISKRIPANGFVSASLGAGQEEEEDDDRASVELSTSKEATIVRMRKAIGVFIGLFEEFLATFVLP